MPQPQPDQEDGELINDSRHLAPSQVWEELTDQQREHVRNLLTRIAHQYVRAQRESQTEADKTVTPST